MSYRVAVVSYEPFDSMILSELIKQDRFNSEAQKVLLNVMVTCSWVLGEMATTMAPFDITTAQYNVLRILRGSHPRALTCSAIGDRLLDRTPDVTRLLNRLEQAELVRRERSNEDRRVVEVAITQKGLELLGRMQAHVDAAQVRLTRHLSEEDQHMLSDLLERLRTDQ